MSCPDFSLPGREQNLIMKVRIETTKGFRVRVPIRTQLYKNNPLRINLCKYYQNKFYQKKGKPFEIAKKLFLLVEGQVWKAIFVINIKSNIRFHFAAEKKYLVCGLAKMSHRKQKAAAFLILMNLIK